MCNIVKLLLCAQFPMPDISVYIQYTYEKRHMAWGRCQIHLTSTRIIDFVPQLYIYEGLPHPFASTKSTLLQVIIINLPSPYTRSSFTSTLLLLPDNGRHQWEEHLVVTRMVSKKVHGLQRKILSSPISSSSMVQATGEPFQKMLVWSFLIYFFFYFKTRLSGTNFPDIV